ncbi:tetratricopeptide repeat protein [Glycocaulis abyssi]|uniref:tetratricopeptide repeat protein n=1 Tax=Glycocaulis abyssi TaxID=1433403 RepID=UPI00352B9EEE
MEPSLRSGGGGAGLWGAALGALGALSLAVSLAVAQEPALPPGLAEEAERDRSGEAIEERSPSDQAMARASAAYVTGDYLSARVHAERAAAAGEPRGATLAGHILLHGLSGTADEAGAVRWLRRAAEHDDIDALVILASLASERRGGLEPFHAREFLSQAAETGDARGAYEFGTFLRDTGDPGLSHLALDWLRLAAEAGMPRAMAAYAAALDDWVHGPGDPSLARPWYIRAGEAGDAPSAAIAGVMLITGEGGPADEEAGRTLLRHAAEMGLPAAMGDYALLLMQEAEGRGGDYQQAAAWARRGAEAGDAQAQFLYAGALATGRGVLRNMEQAYVWVRRAGYPRDNSLEDNPQRDRLEAQLEELFTHDTLTRLEAEAISGMADRYRLNPAGD